MVITRSQSLRVSQSSYGKLQEPPDSKDSRALIPEGHQQVPRFRRSLSFRHRRERPHSRNLETSSAPPERLDPLPNEFPTVNLGDTEQLIQDQNQGSQRIRQYKKRMDCALRRTWGNFLANIPGVTLSRSRSPTPPVDSTSQERSAVAGKSPRSPSGSPGVC